MAKLNSMLLLCLCFVILCVVVQSDSAKILAAFTSPSLSHHIVFRPFTAELARRGHDVTVITTDPAFPKGKSPKNLREIDLHEVSYNIFRDAIQKTVTGSSDIITQMIEINYALTAVFEAQMKTEEIQNLLNETREYDLIVVEACLRPPLIFSHLFKGPVIAFSTFGRVYYNDEMMGMPTHPLIYPTMLNQRIYNLTTWEKIVEIYKYARIKLGNDNHVRKDDEMFKTVLGPDTPSLIDLSKNVDMLLMYLHPIWSGNVPVPPNVIQFWGFPTRQEKELPEDLQKFLDSSKHGVIYMSFGTAVFPSSLQKDKIQAFLKVFSHLPYDVLLKWDKDELPGRPKNVRIGKWFPQSDLLRHPNIKLFITHAGLQSTEEAMLSGVPLVAVPILGDQWYNAEKYEHHRIGKKLNIETLTDVDVKHAIESVLADDSYRENMIRLRTLMKDDPQSGLEKAIWWTEYVIRHKGAKHLRSPAANMPLWEYYELPLVLSVLLLIFIVLLLIVVVLRFLAKRFVFMVKPKIKRQ